MLESIPFYYILKDSIGLVLRRRRSQKLSNTELVEKRQYWRHSFEEHIRERRAKKLREDVIIRDIDRVDDYPNTDSKKRGISAWFKVGLLETYHRGVMVGLGWERLRYLPDNDQWVFADRANDPTESVENLMFCGYIPFEYVASVNWEGDEYYNEPHIYCHFAAKKGQPYEDFEFCRELYIQGLDQTRFIAVGDLKTIKKESRKRGRWSLRFKKKWFEW